MSAEEVRRRSFSTAFRGFDQSEVRAFLERIADELEDADRHDKEMRSELRDARDRILHPRLDEDTLTSALGQEAAQILRSAHEAAADVRRKAEEHAARVLGDAHREAEGIRAAAQTVMGERTMEAEAAADAIRAAAEAEAETVVMRARQLASTSLEEARSHCATLSQEADQMKGRVLGDLARRRRVMSAQVEQLGAGRETLLRALHEVRRMLDQTVDSLDRIAGEAKTAAEEARVRAMSEPEAEASELEREAGAALSSPLDGLAQALAHLEQSLTSLAAGETPEALAGAAGAAPGAGPDATVSSAEAAPEVTAETSAGPVPEAADLEPAEATDAEAGDEAEAGSEPLTEYEKRGSSLRLLRRGKPRPAGGSAASYAPEPDEGVRVIRSVPAPGPEEEAAEAADGGAATTADAEPEPSEPELAEAQALEVAEEADDEGPPKSVDALFARLRADRAAAREEAEAVLASAEGAPAPQAAEGAEGAEEAGGDGADHAGQPDEPAAEVAGSQNGTAPDAEAEEAPLLEMRNRMLGSVPERLARRLKRTLQDDQNEVLDRVRGTARGRTGPLLPEESEHRSTYAAAVGPLVEEAYRAGALYAAEVFPGAAAPSGGRNGEVADALATELVVQLRARLTAVFEGPEDGEADDLADGASAAYRAWKGERVESLAMDYVVDSFTAGLLASVPEGTRVRWIVDDDGGPCPDCDDNSLAGATTAGESFPTGQQHPPAHPGCRCLLAPALT